MAFAVVVLLLASACSDRPPPNTVHTTVDVTGKIIGALYGSPSIVLAEELGFAREYPTGAELMFHLKAGALDCVIMENTAATELVAGVSGVRILSEPLYEYDIQFAVAKENARLLKEVNSALTDLRENGTLRGLLNKYFAGKSFTYVPPDNVETHPGYLTLAVSTDNPPYSYINEDGEISGLDIEVSQAVCDILGVELRIVEFDARELVTAVWFGWADLALGWLPIEGEELVDISEAYASTMHVVIVRR